MILHNPDSGGDIETVVSGKTWKFPKGKTLDFTDYPEAGLHFKNTYGFLEEVESIPKPEIKESDGKFTCSVCGYSNATKVALYPHMKRHPEGNDIKAEKAKPGGAVEPNPSLHDMRMMAQGYNPDDSLNNGKDRDGVEWYGEGFQEERGSLNLNGKPGSFGGS